MMNKSCLLVGGPKDGNIVSSAATPPFLLVPHNDTFLRYIRTDYDFPADVEIYEYVSPAIPVSPNSLLTEEQVDSIVTSLLGVYDEDRISLDAMTMRFDPTGGDEEIEAWKAILHPEREAG